jgi:hypothetical protein
MQQSQEVKNFEVYNDFMAVAQQAYKSRQLREERNFSGFRAPGMLKVIGDALKRRLCRTDMTFLLENEEADGVRKF